MKDQEQNVPFTAAACVSLRAAVTGWLTVRGQITGWGKPVATEESFLLISELFENICCCFY